jgi:hypothetical protein
MNKIMMALVISFAFLTQAAFSATPPTYDTTKAHTGKVMNVWASAEGTIAAKIINVDNPSDNYQNVFFIDGTKPGAKNLMAILMTAWQNQSTSYFLLGFWSINNGQTYYKLKESWISNY